MSPPLSGKDAGLVKSDASATLFPTMGILAASSSGKYLPACTDCEPTAARYLPSTAFWPQSAAVFGSFLVSQTVSVTGLPLMPSFLLSAFTAALAPSAISGVVTPPENSDINMSFTGVPVGLAAAGAAVPTATRLAASTAPTNVRTYLCVRGVRIATPPRDRAPADANLRSHPGQGTAPLPCARTAQVVRGAAARCATTWCTWRIRAALRKDRVNAV